MIERINLVPRPALAGRIKKLTPVLCVASIVIGCLVVFLYGWKIEQQNRQLKEKITLLEQRQAAIESQQLAAGQLAVKVKELKAKEQELAKRVAEVAGIARQKHKYSKLLNAISKMLPATVRCEAIHFGDKSGTISGKATEYRDIPGFVEKLSQLDQLQSVSLQILNQEKTKDSELLAFTIVFGMRS